MVAALVVSVVIGGVAVFGVGGGLAVFGVGVTVLLFFCVGVCWCVLMLLSLMCDDVHVVDVGWWRPVCRCLFLY